jgi:DegV family protein with EDD domain
VGVFISTELSGTVASALAAQESLPDLPIEVVDSRFTSMGLGFVALAAARAAAEGKGLAEVAAAARELVPRVNVLFVVETLEYLHRGGRIGGASRLLGSALRINPLRHLTEGRIDALERVRTKRKAVERILEVMAERAGNAPVHAAVIHANAPEEAARLREQVRERFPYTELYLAELSPVIGTHVGPGTVGVAFYTGGGE